MTIIKRTIVGLFTGVVGGAILGAAVNVAFALPTFIAGHSFFDKLDQFLVFVGFIGAAAGLIAGGIIGVIVGVLGLRKLYGALTGVVVILILAVYVGGSPASFNKALVILTIMSAVSAAAFGALIATITSRRSTLIETD